jgi:ankyrin repeat protein
LHLAVWDGHKDVAKLLLAKGAEVNPKEPDNDMPLHTAIVKGNYDVVKLLLTNGADVNVRSDDGTPLSLALIHDRKDLGRLLLAYKAKYTIHDVAFIGDLEKVKALLKDHPEQVFSREDREELGVGRRGCTPLHSAALGGNKGVTGLLLVKGADVNARDDLGITPLHSAAEAGHKDIVKLLLVKGADVNAKSQNSCTPLHVAASQGHKDVTELLLAKGAKVNAEGPDGATPLQATLSIYGTGNKGVVKLLKQHGGH